jgi:methionyl-tRNA formyltransferase
MKIIFIGSVQIGLTVLEAVYEANGHVDLIFTLPFEMEQTTSGFVDFEPLAVAHKTQIVRTKNINSKENIKRIKEIDPDLIIVCGWQRLVCKEIIEIPKRGAIGFHSSLLPKYRGRAPVNWAILMGEKETGITMFYITPGVDDGEIIAQKAFPILFDDDCSTVYQKAARAGAQLITEYLPGISDGTAPKLHNESASHPAYPKRNPEDGHIDFNRSALDVYNFIRALTKPYPGAYYIDKNKQKIVVWKAGIVFDESRIRDEDIVMQTKDMKIVLLDYEFRKI